MSPALGIFLFHLLLLGIEARSVRKLGQVKMPDTDHVPDQKLLPLSELLDLDEEQRHRLVRGTEEEEQQSTFGQSFENDSMTPPHATEFSHPYSVAAGGPVDEGSLQGNISLSNDAVPEFLNPFYPLAESSYAAFAILFLAGVVVAVGVVGNMVVMCVVWNNYYMRSSWNYLLASMAFWDFLVLVLCLPVVVLNHLSHKRILGEITCRMVPYMEVGGASNVVREENVLRKDIRA